MAHTRETYKLGIDIVTPENDLGEGGDLIQDNTKVIADKLEAHDTSLAAKATASDLTAHTSNTTTAHGLDTALAAKANASDLTAHEADHANPHATTASQVGAYSSSQVDTALAAKADASALTSHTSNTSNPHSTTASQVGAYTAAQVDTALAAKADTSALNTHTANTTTAHGINNLATSAALTSHTSNTSNPHSTTASQVGAYSTSQADTLLAAKVPTSLTITATAPITIGGGTSADLSANRTIAINNASTSVAGAMSAADKTTLDGLHASQTQNKIYASPNGTSGNPTFRALVEADITNLTTDLAAKASASSLSTHVADTAAHGATAANTASKIVTRDSSGNFAASGITASGNVVVGASGDTDKFLYLSKHDGGVADITPDTVTDFIPIALNTAGDIPQIYFYTESGWVSAIPSNLTVSTLNASTVNAGGVTISAALINCTANDLVIEGGDSLTLHSSYGGISICDSTGTLGFCGADPVGQQTISGATTDDKVASIIALLQAYGLSSTATVQVIAIEDVGSNTLHIQFNYPIDTVNDSALVSSQDIQLSELSGGGGALSTITAFSDQGADWINVIMDNGCDTSTYHYWYLLEPPAWITFVGIGTPSGDMTGSYPI